MQEYEIEFRNIVKRFGPVVANNHVSFGVKKGEIHALIGENGAGKSTLMNILYGMCTYDEGEIYYKGNKLSLDSPRETQALGIGMVHQHFMLSPSLTVGENITLGSKPAPGQIWNERALKSRLQELTEDFSFDVPLNTKVRDLSVGIKQRVEIIKTLYRGTKLLILDEPTAVLTPLETEELFISLRKLQEKGETIIFISHKLKEVMEISDRITVMRAGKVIGTVDKSETDTTALAKMMIGRDLVVPDIRKQLDGAEVLCVKELVVMGDRGKEEVSGVSFNLRAGEILGVAGVEGNGQTELSECLIGARRSVGGSVTLCGKDVTKWPIRKRIRQGVALIPQERMTEGMALSANITDNIIITKINSDKQIYSKGIIHWKQAKSQAKELIDAYQIRADSENTICGTLSGGNMQKVIVAREMSGGPQVIIACQPTRGVDIGASEYIHKKLTEARDQGSAILLISADLDEIMELSDRIIVMFEGEITGEIETRSATTHLLGKMMFGKVPDEQ